MRLAGHDVVGVFRERVTARPGELLHVRLDPARLHLFDGQSGLRLTQA
jgi:multiple sugar transport system ATP-binding protein